MMDVSEHIVNQNEWPSSKGNQMKWLIKDVWYKADYAGYQGFAEFVVSQLLRYSNLKESEYVTYEVEQIKYGAQNFTGCKSKNFLPVGWQLITLERLFSNHFGHGLNKSIYAIESLENRVRFIVEQTERITQLRNFGAYMSQLLTMDAFFLNEDRHTHNIAVLMDDQGNYHLCPIFDNGASLLSDTKMDYPIQEDVYPLMKKVRAKTFTQNFDEQLDVVEKLYGKHLQFTFTKKDVERIVLGNMDYSMEIKQRILRIIFDHMRKYGYLLKK